MRPWRQLGWAISNGASAEIQEMVMARGLTSIVAMVMKDRTWGEPQTLAGIGAKNRLGLTMTPGFLAAVTR